MLTNFNVISVIKKGLIISLLSLHKKLNESLNLKHIYAKGIQYLEKITVHKRETLCKNIVTAY